MGKDDILYIMENKKMFQTTNQSPFWISFLLQFWNMAPIDQLWPTIDDRVPQNIMVYPHLVGGFDP